MQKVFMTLRDELTGEKIERSIDASNVTIPQGDLMVIADPEKQFKLLEKWIEERGNAQHNTALSLICWYVK